jgi:hypothetical protein
LAKTLEAIGLTFEELSRIGWSSKLPYLRASVSTDIFTRMLSWEWFNDDLINTLMEYIMGNLKKSALEEIKEAKIIVAPLEFAKKIVKCANIGTYTKESSAGLLLLYEKRIKQHDITKLIFPANINDNHWIAGCIDFVEEKIGYGEYCHY